MKWKHWSDSRAAIVGIRKTWWIESHDWSAGMGGLLSGRRDRQDRWGGGLVLYLVKRFDYADITVSDDVFESLWVYIRVMGSKGEF